MSYRRIREKRKYVTHHNSIWMTSLMHLKLLPRAKTRRTNINTIILLANRGRTLDANRMGQVATAIIALYLQTRLIDDFFLWFMW